VTSDRLRSKRKDRALMAEADKAASNKPAGPATVAGDGESLTSPDRPHPAEGEAKESKPEPSPASSRAPRSRWKKGIILGLLLVALVAGGFALAPAIHEALVTVSTDDAYINGHVTSLAARVPGQVTRVFVDDNMRVKRGDVLVQLDREPYQVQLAIRKAAVTSAEAKLASAKAQALADAAQIRASRYQLERAIEDLHTKVADLQAYLADLASQKALLDLARANLKRAEQLLPGRAISKEDFDVRRQTVRVSEAKVEQAYQVIYATRVGLGLPAKPPTGEDLGHTPPDLDQNYSGVRTALGALYQATARLGYVPSSWRLNPKAAVEEFLKLHSAGDVDKIYDKLMREAPGVKEAEAALEQARRDQDDTELDLRYCDVVSEIDGVVTRRNVNPGNNVQARQALMAIRSETEIWVDANFKETQLADLRIGQRVKCRVDLYGSRQTFEGRITGFTMGTGQTLALLPPENATGNFVKIVQRLPVRIEFTNYDPDKTRTPLFVGLSVVPGVYYKEKATGPHAGEVLQPARLLARRPTTDQLPMNPMPGVDSSGSASATPTPR
jgi:membrane fusion protein, multidrug efflux system